jgi:hypothetical protein
LTGRKALSALAAAALLALAPAAGAQPPPVAGPALSEAPPAKPEPMEDDLKAFAAGQIATDCRLPCAFRWGYHRREAQEIFAARRWKDLARFVQANMENSDLPYFYLGVAAYHLGYYDAADKYLHRAYALSNGLDPCNYPFDECSGHVFPDEEVKQFLLVQAARKGAP